MSKLEKKLLLQEKTVTGSVNAFPENNPIEISAFKYSATRMGGAPTITATVMYDKCLDGDWHDGVFVEFNGEKYYLKQTPTSSKSNDDLRYKHSIELISERAILDDVYFYDAVKPGSSAVDDKPVSNSTKFVFWGDIREFAKRLKASLNYSGIDYDVEVDAGTSSDEKMLSFEDSFFSNAIQEAYNTYEVPYYFEGKTIHFGKSGNDIDEVFKYGVDNQLVSITKTNQNYKIVNRVTGRGSTDNIPYYYPNNSPKGDLEATLSTSSSSLKIQHVDYNTVASKLKIGQVITYGETSFTVTALNNGKVIPDNWNTGVTVECEFLISQKESVSNTVQCVFTPNNNLYYNVDGYDMDGRNRDEYTQTFKVDSKIVDHESIVVYVDGVKQPTISTKGSFVNGFSIDIPVKGKGCSVRVSAGAQFRANANFNGGIYNEYVDGTCTFDMSANPVAAWCIDNNAVDLQSYGINCVGTPGDGDTITINLKNYTNTSANLMPPIYRDTFGAERFYNAINGAYGDVSFNNPFVEGKPKEHIVNFEDIKPTIEKAVNSEGQRIDIFSDFAYDTPDSDETYEDDEDNGDVKYKHGYFFAKLRKLPFNLFDHAIESQPMTISFTSGSCGACKFKIGVTDGFPQKNPVQVDSNGNLVRDDQGRVVCGVHGDVKEFQQSQQDTINNEVWIALMKEEETYGILMPKAPVYDDNGNQIESGFRPSTNDTFVITGIHLPQSYITDAENRLKDELIKYMSENNDEKFNFGIKFSRIYFEENGEILNTLNENSRIKLAYNKDANGEDVVHDLYIKSFSYSMSDGDILPEISIELSDTLTIGQNAIRNAINEVKTRIDQVESNTEKQMAMRQMAYVQKQVDDTAQGTITFAKGIKFGENGHIEVLDNNSAKLTIDYLEVTKKATFTSLEIQERTHVGGQMLVTPAAMLCNLVEEFDDFYRCYFQTNGESGEEIFNQFVSGDQAICQTYNAIGSKYYWRLVVDTGRDFVDLSKSDCDEGSSIPEAGDRIIQLGNRMNIPRQNAIAISSHGTGSPSIIQYKGIDSYSLRDSNIVTKLSSEENIFTGKVHMSLGSSGFENIFGDVSLGGSNMLRNSGFTGMYLSETLADESVLEATKNLYNDQFIYWDIEANDLVEVVNIPDSSASGYGIKIADNPDKNSVFQMLYSYVIGGEDYVFSFKAKANSGTSVVSIWCGNARESIEISDYWQMYSIKFSSSTTSQSFGFVAHNCIMCELQLEKGNVATAWNPSYLDNSSDRAYYESIKPIENALNGFTDVLGGLVLTNHIKVGDESNNSQFVEHGGMSGLYTDENSPAFWAGETFDVARDTAEKYESETLSPNGEAPFVVTHGGKVIMNDAVVRGKVFATDGEFTGKVNAKEGTFSGKITAEEGSVGPFDINYWKLMSTSNGSEYVDNVSYGRTDTIELASSFLGVKSEIVNNSGQRVGYSQCTLYPAAGAMSANYSAIIRNHAVPHAVAESPFWFEETPCVALIIGATGANNINSGGYGGNFALQIEDGMIGGLRPHARVITTTANTTLSKYDHTIVMNIESGTGQLTLPQNPQEGQRYEIYTCHHAMDLKIYMNGQNEMYNFIDAKQFGKNDTESYTSDKRRHIVIFFAGGQWWETYRYLEK